MARTWTLHSTLSTNLNSISLNRALVAGGAVYFYGGAGPVVGTKYHKIFKWDSSTLTDITGTTFPTLDGGSNDMSLYDFCIFNGSIYCIYGRGANAISDDIYRHTGGTSWTNEHTLVDEGAAALHAANSVPGNQEGRFFIMDADASYMAIVCSKGSGASNWRLVTRNTSGSYTVNQRPGSSYTAFVPQLVGLSKGSQYGSLVGNYDTASADYRPIQIGGPTPWSHLAGSAIGDRRLIGYGDGKSFFTVLDGSNWELKYSTDWGVNLTAAGNLEQGGSDRSKFIFKDCGSGVIMLSLETENAYTWDPATDTFVADGAITAGLLLEDYFVLNGVLYAITTSFTSSSVDVWTAGPVGTAGFYYGRGGLQNRAAMPFPFINIGGLAVPRPYAVLGNGEAAAQMVAYAGPDDDYGSFTDFTGGLSTADAIQNFDSTPWGDAAGASESGEDSGPGGGLTNGKC